MHAIKKAPAIHIHRAYARESVTVRGRTHNTSQTWWPEDCKSPPRTLMLSGMLSLSPVANHAPDGGVFITTDSCCCRRRCCAYPYAKKQDVGEGVQRCSVCTVLHSLIRAYDLPAHPLQMLPPYLPINTRPVQQDRHCEHPAGP
jgi:hypothetical protein